MCVIIVKDKKGTLPKKETLETCFNKNKDGAGFMYVESGKVVIDKGYMSFKNFYRHYKRLCEKFNNFENKNLIMHMRISTSGGIERENTHPFPMTNDYNDMKKLYYRTNIGIAHNGIISATNPTKEQENMHLSDTMIFIKAYLNTIYSEWKTCFENYAFLEGIDCITNSKFAILDNNDELKLIGDFKEHDGALYSNYSYYTYSGKTKSYNGYNYDSYYNYDGFEQYGYDYYDYNDNSYKYDKEDYTELYDDDITEVILDNSDLVAFSLEDDFVTIESLRTEDDSIFIFDKATFSLQERNKKNEIIKNYNSVYIYDTNKKLLY